MSQPSDPDCISVVVLKNYEPELFNTCLQKSCFPDNWKASSVFPLIKNVGEKCTARNYHCVSLPSVINSPWKTCIGFGVGLLIIQRYVAFFLIFSSTVLGLLDPLQIFWQFYLIELLQVLEDVGILELGILNRLLFVRFGISTTEFYAIVNLFMTKLNIHFYIFGI